MNKELPIKIELPEGFLDEEIRCDYKISKKMKAIWAIELDLLIQLLDVCKKNEIKIFASGGTMLGAIRHKGFIPWDDDIDLMMFREDYNKLCEIAPFYFKEPYFFQTEETDPGSLRGHAQLRNSNTTAFLKEEKLFGCKFNQGIFIDIFPLDSVIDNPKLLSKQVKTAKRYRHLSIRLKWMNDKWLNEDIKNIKDVAKRVVSLLFPNSLRQCLEMKYNRKFENICAKYSAINTAIVSSLTLDPSSEIFYKDRADYEELFEAPFEFISIPVGKNFDHALTRRYGNYMEFVKGTSTHGGIFFDPYKSYKEYLKNNM